MEFNVVNGGSQQRGPELCMVLRTEHFYSMHSRSTYGEGVYVREWDVCI